MKHISTEEIVKINDRLSNSSTLLEYFTKIEEELVGKFVDGCEIHSIKMYKGSMGYVRTSHTSPRGQKTTGWHDKHIGEIGWNGRAQITYKGNRSPEGFEKILGIINIKSGSGGYNGGNPNLYKLNYDSLMFIKDFPLIYEQYLTFVNNPPPIIELVSELLMGPMLEDIKLAQGLLDNNKEFLSYITNIVKVIKGWNLYKNVPCGTLNLYKSIITPYNNVTIDREVWDENKNIGWMIEDDFYKYGTEDFKYLI